MSEVSRFSPAAIDSIAVAGVRTAIRAVGLGMVAAPVVLDAVAMADISNWELQLLAVLFVALAALGLVLGNAPKRYPFGPRTSTLVLALTLVAAVFDALSRSGTMTSSRLAWGPISLAGALLVLGALRPAVEIVPATVVSVFAVGLAIVSAGGGADVHAYPWVSWAMAAGPPLACGLASAVYSATISQSLQRTGEEQRQRREQDAERLRAEIDEAERADRVALVEAKAAPFLRAVLAGGEVTAVVSHRSRRLAEELREALAQQDDSWLNRYVDALGDPLGLTRRFNDQERFAIAGFVESARQRGPASSPTPRVTARAWRADGRVVLQLRVAGNSAVGRDQRLALVRQVFPGAEFHGGAGASTLTVSTRG